MLYNEEWQSDREIGNDSDSSYVPDESSGSESSGDEYEKPGKPGKSGPAKHPMEFTRSTVTAEVAGTSPANNDGSVPDVAPWGPEMQGVSQTRVTTADDVTVSDDDTLLPPPIEYNDNIFELLLSSNEKKDVGSSGRMKAITANGECFESENSDKGLVPLEMARDTVPVASTRSLRPSTSQENFSPRPNFEIPRMLTQKTDRILNSYFKLETEETHPYICRICDKKFQTPKCIKRHMRSHLDFKEFECDICAKTFGRKHTLEVHKRTHSTLKPHICTVCSRGFREKTTLNQHMKVHSNDRPFVCGVCDRGFKSKRLLQRHCLGHTNAKPFPCEYCDKSFARKCTLTDHLRYHFPEKKKHLCSFCGKDFQHNSGLTKHMVVHTGKNKYVCEICDVQCNWSGSLYRHMSRTHGVIWSQKCGLHILPDPNPVTGTKQFIVEDSDTKLPPLRKTKRDVIVINDGDDSDSEIDCSV